MARKKVTEKSLKNLRPFSSEYQSPNRGRKKGSLDRATIARKMLELAANEHNGGLKEFLEKLPETQRGMAKTLHDMMVLGQINSAIEGNTRAAEWLYDQVFGKQAQKQEITGEDGGPIEFRDLTKLSDEELRKIAEGE